MKKIKYLIVSLIVSVGLKACWVKEEHKPIALKGKFINQSYLDRSSDALPGEISFYCTELIFDRPDSVMVKNGFEEYALHYAISHDTCFVKKAYQHKGELRDLVLLLTSDSSFVALEQEYTGSPTPAVFTKTSFFQGFEYRLNQATVAGNYEWVSADGKPSKMITLAENGTIKGLPAFSKFSICYSGDCLSEPAEAAKVILLETAQHEVEFAVWDYEKKTGRLTIYKLEAAKPDIKGERAIKFPLFELRKVV
ncbi:MAG: hypothetical protein U0X91_01580 [Spirosomataceae bacterium]